MDMTVRQERSVLVGNGVSKGTALCFLWPRLSPDEKKSLSFEDLKDVYKVLQLIGRDDYIKEVVFMMEDSCNSLEQLLWLWGEEKTNHFPGHKSLWTEVVSKTKTIEGIQFVWDWLTDLEVDFLVKKKEIDQIWQIYVGEMDATIRSERDKLRRGP